MFANANVLGYVTWTRDIKIMGGAKLFQFGIGVPKSVRMDKVPTAKPSGNSAWGTVYQNIGVKVWGQNDAYLDNFAKRIRKGSVVAIKNAELSFDVNTGNPEIYHGSDGVARSKIELVVSSFRDVDVIQTSALQTAAVPQQKPSNDRTVDYDFDYDFDENSLF